MEILVFIPVSTGIIIVPGPNVLVIVSTSLVHGKVRGLQTVAGTSAAMLIQLGIAALATSWFVAALVDGFVWLKWLGVIYLFYLGADHLLAVRNAARAQVSAVGTFQRGFWVSLTNPKTIVFFSAFLPQFTVPGTAYRLQIAELSIIFWLLAVVLDTGYALLANQLSAVPRIKNVTKYQRGASGVLYLAAGTMLASTRNG